MNKLFQILSVVFFVASFVYGMSLDHQVLEKDNSNITLENIESMANAVGRECPGTSNMPCCTPESLGPIIWE